MHVVCFGDSNTWGYDPRGFLGGRYDTNWVDLLARKTGWTVENRGLNGRTVPTTPVSFSQNTDLLILMLGTNDLLQGTLPEDIAAKLSRFMDDIRLPGKQILLLAPPALTVGEWVQEQELITRSQLLSAYYREVAARQGTAFIDTGLWNIPLAFDGAHFTEEGHRIFGEKLCCYLIEGEYYAGNWNESTRFHPT